MASKFAQVKPEDYTIIKKLAQTFLNVFTSEFYFKTFFRAEIRGLENIPKEGKFIIASTHSSYFDPFIVVWATRIPVAFMAKEELFHVPVLSQAIQLLGAFSVNREKLEVSTIKSAKNIIDKTEWMLGIYPQGTRVQGRKVGKINPGLGYLAKLTKAQVIPMVIDFRRPVCPFFGKLIVSIGAPLDVAENPEELLDKWGQTVADLSGYEYNKEESLPQKTESASV